MPLRDHFRPPLYVRKSWESVHAMWAATITGHLNGDVLPNRYRAEPEVSRGSRIETIPDESDPAVVISGASESDTVAARTYTAPAAVLTADAEFAAADLFEVRVFKAAGGWKLVAAIELVSPANKDRPSARRAFAGKCGAYLAAGVSVVVVDVVTERSTNLHADLIERLHLPDVFAWESPTGLFAASYRAVGVKDRTRLDVWPHPLGVGSPLPTVPLWLEPDFAVPLDLDPTYAAACQSLRIE